MLKKLFNWAKQSKTKEVSQTSEKSSASSTMHILIDYENLLPQNLDKIPRNDNSHIWLFVGSRQTKLNAGLVRAMQDFGDRAHQIYLDAAYRQPNALDFILSYYLGYIAATYPQPHVAILSKDKGYEMVIDHAREHHNFLNITRYDNNDYVEKVTPNSSVNAKQSTPSKSSPPVTTPVKRQPIVVKTPTSPFGQAFREAIIYLTDQEKYHPRMRERLENLFAKEIITPIFSAQEENFTEEQALNQAKKLVDQLRVSRLIEIEDKEVGLLIYHTDEESLYQRMKYFVMRKQPKHVVPLKEMVAYNYSHREIDDKEIEALIERLKQENILYLVKGGHVNYMTEESTMIEEYDLDELANKAIEFLNRGHALPRNKSSLFNVIGTHTNTKDNEQALQMIIDRLLERKLIKFDKEDQVIYLQKNNE